MASEYTPLNDSDTKEFRKALGLPTTKGLRYLYKESGIRDAWETWNEKSVVDYSVQYTYQSGACTLQMILEDGSKVNIHSDYLADMQKPTFTNSTGSRESAAGSKAGGDDTKKERSKKKSTKKLPDTYIVVDLETTGMNYYDDEIIEIGAIKYVKGEETDRYSVLVKPGRALPDKIKELTGITDEMLERDGIDKMTAVMQLWNFIGDEVLVGHNIAYFDSKFMDAAFMDVLKCHFSNKYVDTLPLARKARPDLKRFRLKDLAEAFGIDYSRAHRAVEDCEINHFVYECLVGDRTEKSN